MSPYSLLSLAFILLHRQSLLSSPHVSLLSSITCSHSPLYTVTVLSTTCLLALFYHLLSFSFIYSHCSLHHMSPYSLLSLALILLYTQSLLSPPHVSLLSSITCSHSPLILLYIQSLFSPPHVSLLSSITCSHSPLYTVTVLSTTCLLTLFYHLLSFSFIYSHCSLHHMSPYSLLSLALILLYIQSLLSPPHVSLLSSITCSHSPLYTVTVISTTCLLALFYHLLSFSFTDSHCYLHHMSPYSLLSLALILLYIQSLFSPPHVSLLSSITCSHSPLYTVTVISTTCLLALFYHLLSFSFTDSHCYLHHMSPYSLLSLALILLYIQSLFSPPHVSLLSSITCFHSPSQTVTVISTTCLLTLFYHLLSFSFIDSHCSLHHMSPYSLLSLALILLYIQSLFSPPHVSLLSSITCSHSPL